MGAFFKKKSILLMALTILLLGGAVGGFFYWKKISRTKEANSATEDKDFSKFIQNFKDAKTDGAEALSRDLKENKISKDKVAQQLMYSFFDTKKVDKKYLITSAIHHDSHQLDFVLQNYNSLSPEVQGEFRKYFNTLLPKVDLDEEITTDDAGAVLERKSIPKKSALLNIPVAHAEGDFGQFENEWRQMTKVMKNSYCAVFYTTTNVNGNNDAVSETDVRSALSGCTNAAIKYKAWGWNSGPVRVTDNSAPQLKSNLYINGDTSKTRIPIFLYNTSGNEDSSVNGLFVPNNELSWVPLNGFTALMANNIGHGLTGSKRDYEFKATSAHEVSHYCQFFTNYSTHYLLTNEAFTEWTSSIVFPAPDFRTNYNNETYQYAAKGMHIPLKDYLKQDLSKGFM
jgi:hypothetical protein